MKAVGAASPEAAFFQSTPDLMLRFAKRSLEAWPQPPQKPRIADGAYVYILRCADSSYYTGITQRSVEERESEHNLGLAPASYTHTRRPVTVVFSAHFPMITDAIGFERRVKGWSRAKKEALIAGAFDHLPELSRRRVRSLHGKSG
jgi:putative endonuclease